MEKQKKEKGVIVRPRGLTVLGIIMFAFAITGMIFTGVAATNFGKDIFNQTTQKKEFEKIITSVVMQDPPTVEEVSFLDNSTIVLAGIYEVIFNENIEKYIKPGSDEENRYNVVIPATDVEMHIKKLFGDNVNFSHATITTGHIIVNYTNPENEGGNGSYSVPRGLSYVGYTPRVSNIRRLGNEYRLTVRYMSAASLWDTFTAKSDLTTTKVMVYVLQKENNTYKILRIEDTPIGETPSTAPSSEGSSEKAPITPPTDDSAESAVA
jgi:hypothetical protein